MIYDIAKTDARRKVEQLLRKAGFIYLFRNTRWSDHATDHAALARRIAAAARGHDFRILMFVIPRRAADDAKWICGRRAEEVR